MAVKVLVVTPYMALGRLIRQSLEQSNYEVQTTELAEDALELAMQIYFSVAILDADVNDLTIVDLGQGLQAHNPNLHLVVMPPNNDPESPLLDGLAPHAFLHKPFYLPDLLQTIEGLLTASPDAPLPFAKESDPAPVFWYEDPAQTFEHLRSISLGPGISAALITCEGELWADIGQLSGEAAAELAATTIRYWDGGKHGDLARFVTLKSNGCLYFLYATHLMGNQVLTLICDSNMPFSRIRSQSKHFARLLIESSAQAALPARVSMPSSTFDPDPTEIRRRSTPLPLDDTMPIEPDSDLPLLFDDIPAPDPAFQDLAASGWEKEEDEDLIPTRFNGQEDPDGPGAQAVPALSMVELPESSQAAPAQPDFTSAAIVVANLTCTAVLIPRLSYHLLDEELAAQLKRWMPQISLAFDWNLQSLSIQPGYLLWVIRLAPEVAPGQMVAAVRLHTSQRIFKLFPSLAEENPSGDFWAPGFLVASGAGVLTPEAVEDFSAQVRRRQTPAEF